MSDSIVNKLRLQAQSLNTDATLYGTIIDNNKLLYRPTDAYMQNLVDHKAGFVSQREHAISKSQSLNCLGCDKVLTCLSKCDKL